MGRVTSWLRDAAIKIGPILPSRGLEYEGFWCQLLRAATGCEVLRHVAAADKRLDPRSEEDDPHELIIKSVDRLPPHVRTLCLPIRGWKFSEKSESYKFPHILRAALSRYGRI